MFREKYYGRFTAEIKNNLHAQKAPLVAIGGDNYVQFL
jgi:hypothetical protein